MGKYFFASEVGCIKRTIVAKQGTVARKAT
jgi:hypothetical protein